MRAAGALFLAGLLSAQGAGAQVTFVPGNGGQGSGILAGPREPAAVAPAELPVPRPLATILGGTVMLDDLFENAGPRGATPLGPAPLPGRRFVIESPQLAIIARDNGLSWQPLGGDERVVVERPGRPLSREEIDPLLMAELSSLGAEPGLDLEVAAFQPLMVPDDAVPPRLTLEGVEYDVANRRFAVTLVVLADGLPTMRRRLSGRVLAMRDAVVAARALRSGETLTAADLRAQRLPADRVRPGSAERLERVIGQRIGRSLSTGQPVMLADLVPAPAIMRDGAVQLLHSAPGLSIAAQGRALEDGAIGASIAVQNLATGAVVLAEVLGPGQARAIGPAPSNAVPPGRARGNTTTSSSGSAASAWR